MYIFAVVSAVRTRPEPTVLALFNGLNEIFANFVCRGFGIAMLGHNDLPQFVLVPVVTLFLLSLFLLHLTSIRV